MVLQDDLFKQNQYEINKKLLFKKRLTFIIINKIGIGLGLNNCKTIVGELGPTSEFQVESVQNQGSKFTFQVYQNNLKYSEQIKEEDEEEQEQEEDIAENQPQVKGDDSEVLTQSIKNQPVTNLKYQTSPQKNEIILFKDKNQILKDYSNQSGNTVFEDSPTLLKNQCESPIKKPSCESKVGIENKRLHYQASLKKQNSQKTNLHDSQDLNSIDMISIQEYNFSHPPNQVYPSINIQTSQILQSCKQLDSKQNETSSQLLKVSNDKRVSYIQNNIKKSVTSHIEASSEEASFSEQSSSMTMSSGKNQNFQINIPLKKLILQQQNTYQSNTPKEKRISNMDDFNQARHLRYSLVNTKLHYYQNYKSSSQYNKMNKEFDNKQLVVNRQKNSKSEISKQKSNSFMINMQQRSTHENFHMKSKHNILIVDDNYFNILALKLLISENENIIVYQAENGEQAVQKIIFMDMQMPIMDGETSAKIIKQDNKIMTPIISLTANEYSDEEKKSLTMFDDFLNKPIQKQKVQQILERYKLI